MASNELIAAIANEMAHGKQEAHVREEFLKKGHSAEDVNGAFAVVRLQNTPSLAGNSAILERPVLANPSPGQGFLLSILVITVVILGISMLVSPIVRNTLLQRIGINTVTTTSTGLGTTLPSTGAGPAINYKEITTRPPAPVVAVSAPKTTSNAGSGSVSGTSAATPVPNQPTTPTVPVTTQTQPQTQPTTQSNTSSNPNPNSNTGANTSSNTTPPPASTPPPPAQPTTSVAAGVAAVGLQAVDGLSAPGAVGPRTTPTCTPTTCADQLAALGATAKDGLVQFTGIGKHVTVSGWDFSGYQLDFEKSADVAFTDSIIKCDCGGPQLYTIILGSDGSAVNVSFSYSDFDLTNSRQDWGGIVIHPSATHIWDHDRFHGAANDPFLAVNGNGTWTYDWFDGGPGQNTRSSSHLELIHMFSGTFLIQHVLASNMKPTTGGTTGMFYFSASTLDGGPANVNATLDSSVIEGAATLGAIFTIQASAGEGPVNLTMTNNALQPGVDGFPKGYYGPTGPVALTSSGNVDYDTGNAILTSTPAAVGASGIFGYLREIFAGLVQFAKTI